MNNVLQALSLNVSDVTNLLLSIYFNEENINFFGQVLWFVSFCVRSDQTWEIRSWGFSVTRFDYTGA